jgi:nitroimidazol reductase NimA-like FMN-containing flavoprotein (pyridoxamine 5'-phosphate oxidase superfamily)
MLGQLTETKMKSILSSQVLGRLACTDGKHPYVVPVTYAYDGKYIYGQTNFGKKLNLLRKNAHVCLEVDLMTSIRNWKSVIVYGKFEELKDKKTKKARKRLFNRVFPLMTSSRIHPFEHGVTENVDDSTRVKDVMYRIKIKKLTGRYEKQ